MGRHYAKLPSLRQTGIVDGNHREARSTNRR